MFDEAESFRDALDVCINRLGTHPPRRDLQCVCGAVWDGDEMVHAPYRREWVSLTDEERGQVYLSIPTNKFDVDYVVRAIEQRLKEKNT